MYWYYKEALRIAVTWQWFLSVDDFLILLTFLLDNISIFWGEIRWWSLLQVPFIANYRKEYIEPELNIEDLWKIWEWDEKVLLPVIFFVAFLAFCPIDITDSELCIIISILIIFIVSGASFALVRRIFIVCFKKCRITSLTRSKRVVTSLLMMIQEFCRQKILTGIISWWWKLPLNMTAQCSEGQLIHFVSLHINCHNNYYSCRPHGSLSQYCQILTTKFKRNVY